MAEKPSVRMQCAEIGIAALLQNPVLVQGLGLTTVIIAATSLRGALWVSLTTSLLLLLCEVLTATVLRKLPSWARVAIYATLGTVLFCPLTYLLDSSLSSFFTTEPTLRLFLPAVAVSSLVAARCERYAVLHRVRDCVRDSLVNALGFSGVAIFVGALREFLGYGSLFGVEFSRLRLRALWMPFGGFLLLGALAGCLKLLLRAFAERGLAMGIEATLSMERGPEDRQTRLEKRYTLLTQDLPKLTPEFLARYEETQALKKQELKTQKPEQEQEQELKAQEQELEQEQELKTQELEKILIEETKDAPSEALSSEELERSQSLSPAEIDQLLAEFQDKNLS